jgi:hypothetical protein
VAGRADARTPLANVAAAAPAMKSLLVIPFFILIGSLFLEDYGAIHTC